MNLYLKKSGFTLIEMIVVMVIVVLTVMIGSDFAIKGFRATTIESEQATAVQTARNAMEIITKEIRGANASELGDYSLATIDDDNFVFYSDTDDDGKMEKIRYYVDGSLLKRVETQPGPANDYSGAGATTTIASYVYNQEDPIFAYYDSNYNITNLISDIRLIKINLKINVTPERAPNDYTLETDVNLRNLKDNL